MDNENRIEFYQNRSFGERLSAAASFLRQNWKVFFKNIFIPAIPFILLLAYLMPEYMKMVPLLSTGDASYFVTAGSLGMAFLFVMVCLSLYLYAMPGAIMKLYEEGDLTNKTSWSDLNVKMFSNIGKIFLIGLAMFLIIVIVSVLVAFLFSSFLNSGAGMVIFVFIFVIGLIAVIPPLMMVVFPAIFQGASTWKSIGKGFRVGFKNWGSTFGVLFISGVMGAIVSYVFSAPLQFSILFNPGQTNVVIYLFAILSSLGTVLVTPFVFVFLAFQYFSITEKEEGISLQSKIDEFDNL